MIKFGHPTINPSHHQIKPWLSHSIYNLNNPLLHIEYPTLWYQHSSSYRISKV